MTSLNTLVAPIFTAENLKLPLGGYGFAVAPQNGMPVELGIRPEHIAQGPGPIDVLIDLVEPIGSDLFAWSSLAGAPLCMRLPAEAPIARGDRLPIVLPDNRFNLFDVASGQRL